MHDLSEPRERHRIIEKNPLVRMDSKLDEVDWKLLTRQAFGNRQKVERNIQNKDVRDQQNFALGPRNFFFAPHEETGLETEFGKVINLFD